MRLIDADALIDTLYDHEFASYIDKGEVSTVINDEPTVDAVPVEWIEIDIEASAFSGYDMHSYEVATMLEEWKEKERKDNEQTAD